MLYYLGIASLPGKKAHSIQEMKMCEAFARAGEDVVYCHYHVLDEDGGKVQWDDIADHYGLETEFEIKTFRSFHGRTGRFTKIGTLSWIVPMTLYVFFQAIIGRLSQDDVVYGREFYPLYFLSELFRLLPEGRRPTVCLEQHEPLTKRFLDRGYERIDYVVSITELLGNVIAENWGVEEEKIIIAPDGVDLEPYRGFTKADAREELGLPQDEPIVMYTGHCYPGKGVETLVKASEGLQASVYVVGGYEEDIERIKHDCEIPENVIFTGFVEPGRVPTYQVAADILVAPYTSESRPWVSPLKLFEYMAAGRPIVASDRKVLQEVLNKGENALLFERGDANSLQNVLEKTLATEQSLGDAQQRTVRQYTWERRAQSILKSCR